MPNLLKGKDKEGWKTVTAQQHQQVESDMNKNTIVVSFVVNVFMILDHEGHEGHEAGLSGRFKI